MMTSFLSIGVVLSLCVHVRISISIQCEDKKGIIYALGQRVPTDDKCDTCTCMFGGKIECLRVMCPQLRCAKGLLYSDDSCCPTCKTTCEDKNGNIYEPGEIIDTKNPCEECRCSDLRGIECATFDCPQCRGKVVMVDGQCCGDCFVHDVQILPGTGCSKNGTVYGFGDELPTDDSCETCVCDDTFGGDVKCWVESCVPCAGKHVPVPGSCCGECHDFPGKPIIGCEKNGEHFAVGDVIPSRDPCETCFCDGTNGGDIICALIHCAPCVGKHVQVPGSCCGECHDITVQPITGCEQNGERFAVGEMVPTRDPCETCFCDGTNGGHIFCSLIHCAPCVGKHVSVPGSCCGECHDMTVQPIIGCEKNGERFNAGDMIPTRDPCETCFCDGTNGGDIVCSPIDCPLCVGQHVPIPGSCCGECLNNTVKPIIGCEWNGEHFDVGELVETEDKCNVCMCQENGTVVCQRKKCRTYCPEYLQQYQDGICCPICRRACVNDKNQTYAVGDVIPIEDPCEKCVCGGGRIHNVNCVRMACPPCPGIHVPVEGTCCGECDDVSIQPVLGCDVNGIHFDVGPFVDPTNKCNDCMCHENGEISCREVSCPRPRCRRSLIVQPDDKCCPVCQCVRNKKKYMPGPVGNKCDGCVCDNGRITCQPPLTACPRIGLTCVDMEQDDKCCMHCPQGTTCFAGNKVIRAGVYTKVGRYYCTCEEDPWYPNAYCTVQKIKPRFMKIFGKYLADYSIPGV